MASQTPEAQAPASSGSLFAAATTSSSSGTSLFGSVGASTGSSLFVFGGAPASSSTGTSLFGGTSSSAAPSGASIFGSSASSQPVLFGSSSPGASLFGGSTASSSGSSLFGGSGPSLFGGYPSSSGSGLFGGAVGGSTGLFSATPAPANASATKDAADEDDEYVQEEEVVTVVGWTPSVTLDVLDHVETGEEQEEVVYTQRSKLYRFRDGEWKERGIGDAKLLKHKETGMVRFMLRQERTMKIVGNHYVLPHGTYCDLRPQAGSDKIWVWSTLDYSDGEKSNEQLALRFKDADLAEKFKEAFDSARVDNAKVMDMEKSAAVQKTEKVEESGEGPDKEGQTVEAAKACEEEPQESAAKAEVDDAVVAELKLIDDSYLELKRECDQEVREVLRRYDERQKPLLLKRAQVLAKLEGAEAKDTGTPALRGFWQQALANHPALSGHLEEWDAPVLEYLSDVTKALRDPQDERKGFRLEFHFAENPYFEDKVLWKEYISSEHSPYTGAIDISEIKACDIKWKPGKDVTVEMVQKKKKKGGGAKKASKAKATEEPRSSFFRMFFRSLKDDMPLPPDIDAEIDDDDDEDIQKGIVESLMEQDHDIGCALRDSLIPFAVRWYTGEAMPEGFDDDEDSEDDDEDEEEEEEEQDDEDEDDEDVAENVENGAAAGKKSTKVAGSDAKEQQKSKAKPAKAGSGGDSAGASADQKNKEDCKQQ